MSEKVSLATISAQAAPGEAGYVPPAELVPLPSKGKIYPAESPLHLAEALEIRSMTARDEDILTSRALLKQGKAISTLLKSCILNKSVDPDEMVVGDRNALLIAIRITGYGREYDVTVDCPLCGERVKHEFDLASLELKPLAAEPTAPGKNEFALVLPVSKKAAVFKILTGRDEADLAITMERSKKAGAAVEATVTARLHKALVSLGGETDGGKLLQAVRNLPAKDSKFLRTELDRIAPGVTMTQTFTCSACSEQSEVDVPMGTEFFWPS